MREYTLILFIFIILQLVSVNRAAKYSYGRAGYGDRSLRRFEDPETFETEYGNGSPRFRKYHPNYRYRPSRSGRERHNVDYERDRAYYDGAGRVDDPSIEVIVDPGKKKAVAVIENGPAGQSRYELTGYEMAKEFNEPKVEQQSVNLDNPAVGKTDRKRSQKELDANANVANTEMVDSKKEKRNAELTKRKVNKASKMAQGPVKQDYTDDQVGRLPTKRKSENNKAEDCPPHLKEQTKDQKRAQEAGQQKTNVEKISVKREVANAFSQSQLNTLADSLARVKDSGEDVENLKRVLYDMGLVHKDKRDAESMESLEKQQTKRELEAPSREEDEDMNRDNIVMKRDSEAVEEEAWNDDDEEEEDFDEQMDKRDAESDNWEDAEEVDEGMVDEPVDKMKYGLAEGKLMMNDDENAKETADTALPMRDKRQNEENQEENADANQHEMIDNYAKELQQTNLQAAARNKREQDTNTRKQQSKANEKRSNKGEDKLIKEAENQVTPDGNDADDKKKMTKREDGTEEAKEKRQGSEETKRKVESEIKEKIEMIKEKVKREILEENEENTRDNYYKNAHFQRDVRAADSLDLDGSLKRTKRDLSGSAKQDHVENSHQRDLDHYALKRRANTDGNVTKVVIDYKYNQTTLPINDSKVLDPVLEAHDLKPNVRQHRAVNATTIGGSGQAKVIDTSQDIERKENDKDSDVDCELAPVVRTRRAVARKEQEVVREKRANGDPEKQMVYEPFQNGEVDRTEEEGEFGDNYNDGRLYLDKRQARDEQQYFEDQKGDQQYEESDGSYYDGENSPGRSRRSFEDQDNARIGTAVRTDEREKREQLEGNAKLTDDEQYSENLYFGPLSKTYNEDLVRYKRVKRDKP